MTSSTHIIASTITLCTLNALLGHPLHPAPLAVAAVTSMLPDLDSPQSQIGRRCKPLSAWLYRKVGHRTLTHSIFGWGIAAILLLPLKLLQPDLALYTAAMLGYISHCLLDLANLEGVVLTYPLFPHHRWVFPGDEAYRVKADSPKEHGIRILGILLMTALLALNFVGGRTVFHSFLGTPAAIGREHAEQFKRGHRLIVKIQGVWTRGQGRVDEEFDVVASTDLGIFVRRPSEPSKLYEISSGPFSAISHARLKIIRRIPAEQRLVTLSFNAQKWKPELASQYPNALIAGSLTTRARIPRFGIDEFHTIVRVGNRWELTHAPIESVDRRLRESSAQLTGEIQIRYWKEKAPNANHRSQSDSS